MHSLSSFKDSQLRIIFNKIVKEMTERGMKVAGEVNPLLHYTYLTCTSLGFATDGEFNSLRWKGNTRPLSILQIRSQSRAKYVNRGKNVMTEMLLPVGEQLIIQLQILCARII